MKICSCTIYNIIYDHDLFHIFCKTYKCNVVFVSNICTSWVTVGLGVVIGVDRVRVVLASNSSTLGLLYNVGVPRDVTYDDLISIGT